MKNELSLRQKLQTKLSLRQKLGLELLTKNELELFEYLKEEMESNPLLDPAGEDTVSLPEDGEEFSGFDENWDMYIKSGQPISNSGDYHDLIIESYSGGKNWKDDIELEFGTLKLTEKELEVLRDMLDMLDEDGLLRDYRAIMDLHGLTEQEFEDIHSIFLMSVPPGVGGRDLAESFAVQLHFRGMAEDELFDIVTANAERIKKEDPESLLAGYGISGAKLERYASVIRSLSEHPIPRGEDPSVYIYPDVTVRREENGFNITVSERYDSYFTVNRGYVSMLGDPALGAESRKFLKIYFQRYKNIKNALERRRDTLIRITETLISEQADFFEKGPREIRPLTRATVAGLLDLNPSTVTRAVQSKYIQTDFGLFPMGMFFTGASGSVSTSESGDVSRNKVLEALKKLVDEEDKQNPLTDQQLTDALESGGFNISRRAINKYRGIMNIPPRRERRQAKDHGRIVGGSGSDGGKGDRK